MSTSIIAADFDRARQEMLAESGVATIAAIQAMVCREFGVSLPILVSHRRRREWARARQVAIWLCFQLTPHTQPVIARHFGNRDHTTIGHAIKVVDELVARDDGYGRTAAILLNRLRDDPRQADLLAPATPDGRPFA